MDPIDIRRLRFLVIDSDAHMRRIVRTLLHGFGARDVREAEDGATGFDAFKSQSPDIILTAWTLPIYDGLELVQMIRKPDDNANSFVPIIMMTSQPDKALVTTARDAGVTEFLAKPFSAKALYERIVYVISNPRPFVKTKTFFGPNRRRNSGPKHPGGPDRRRGGKADVTQVQPLIDKTKTLV